jgi:hypothetical protein
MRDWLADRLDALPRRLPGAIDYLSRQFSDHPNRAIAVLTALALLAAALYLSLDPVTIQAGPGAVVVTYLLLIGLTILGALLASILVAIGVLRLLAIVVRFRRETLTELALFGAMLFGVATSLQLVATFGGR